MVAYSLDLRPRVLKDSDVGMASKLVAETYAVSRAWVDRLKQRRRETGEIAPRRQTRWRTPRLHAQLPRLAILIREQPDRTLVEWQQALPTSASLPTIWRAVTKLGCRLKKNVHATDHARPDVAEARAAWQQTAPTWDRARLVFLDESGVRTDLVRRDGRGQRGERVVDHAPDSRWHTTTFLAALRVTGLTAPAVFDGPIDGVSFLAYIEHVLAPTRRPGNIVVLDNLSVHRSPAVRAAVETVGATLCFLPKYSPDLNPIELCFAKLKTILRVARCRAREELWAIIGACVPRFALTECRNYFRHCGYSGATRS